MIISLMRFFKKAVTLYIKVDFEESTRKNRRRYNPDKPDSILEHALEDLKMEMLYKDSDWEAFAADPEYLKVKGFDVPYGVFDNMPEKNRTNPYVLGAHLEEVLTRLWQVYSRR